jgi:BON domain
MDNPYRNWEGGSSRERERERWLNQGNRPDWAQFGGSNPGAYGPESGEWRQGFRGGFGNSGQLSRAAYNRGGVGAGYSEPGRNWGGPGTNEFGPRGGWGTGFEGRGYQGEFGGPGESQDYGATFGPGYGHLGSYPQSLGERAFEGSGWGGGRAHEGSWSERGFGPRGYGGGFVGRDYDWTTRGERDTGSSEGPYVGRGPQGYQRSDERVYEEVCELLTEHGQLDASGIEVRVESAEITLEGTVSDRRSKRLAEEIAESARGVRDVHNRLRVGQSQRDEESARGSESRNERETQLSSAPATRGKR